MAMRAVGIKVLKNKLSEYVRLAERGETVLVTDRDRVVAEIVPPDKSRSPLLADALLADVQAWSKQINSTAFMVVGQWLYFMSMSSVVPVAWLSASSSTAAVWSVFQAMPSPAGSKKIKLALKSREHRNLRASRM
jgi:antitoxin (DNA-binding transcriptional repressor) of toxin-antitoxin stability system